MILQKINFRFWVLYSQRLFRVSIPAIHTRINIFGLVKSENQAHDKSFLKYKYCGSSTAEFELQINTNQNNLRASAIFFLIFSTKKIVKSSKSINTVGKLAKKVGKTKN